MTSRAATPEHAEYQRMLKHSPCVWTLHHDGSGVFAASTSETPPTREELIQGVMAMPRHTWIGRGPDGYPQYDVHVFTREEAEAEVDASMARWPGIAV